MEEREKRFILKNFSIGGRLARLKLLTIRWYQNGEISEGLFDHQLWRIVKLYSHYGKIPESINESAEQIKKKVDEYLKTANPTHYGRAREVQAQK